jgi:alpha-L-rhamnosidase
VEWSKANELVQDVNYPNNMMYYAALQAAANLYKNQDYKIKAEKVKKAILEQSYDGHFFTDHAVREKGILYNDGSKTEVCQYYAFFTGVADKNTHEELFQYMLKNFGPQRSEAKEDIYPAAPFIGNYLRLEILMREGFYQEVLDNIRGYFLYMAERTGTLWEYATENASCNHGFASYVLYWLSKMEI